MLLAVERLYCILCGLDQDTQPMREMVRYRTKYHLSLAPATEDSWSYKDAVGGRCPSVGYDEEASAHPIPKAQRATWSFGVRARHKFYNSPPVSDRVRHSPLSMLPDPSQPSSVTLFSCLSHRDSPPLATLPCLPQVHIWLCAGQPVGGEEGLMQDKATLGTSLSDMLGILQPQLASGVPVQKALPPSQKRGARLQNCCHRFFKPQKPGLPQAHLSLTHDPRSTLEPTLYHAASLPALTVDTSLVCHQGRRLEEGCTLGSKGKLVSQKACGRDLFSFGSLSQAQHYPL